MSGLLQWPMADRYDLFASLSRASLHVVFFLNVMQRIPASVVESKPVMYPLQKAI